MAKITLVAPVSDIRGSIGNMVYSNWRGQAYTRNKASSVANPNSARQETVRGVVTNLSRTWLSALTVAERAGWEEYAQQRGSAKGDDKQVSRGSIIKPLGKLMSGKNCFIGCNTNLELCGITKITAAPLGVNTPGNPTNLALAFTGGATPKITLTWDDATDMGASDKVLIYAYCPGQFHKQQIYGAAKAAETLDVTMLRGASGVNMPITVGLYRFQLATLDTKGQRSAGGNVAEINVTSLA